MTRKLAIALAFASMLAVAEPASADITVSSVADMHASVTAVPMHFRGRCPAVITFKGSITVTGGVFTSHGPPVLIQYQLERSDSATGPVKVFPIRHPGTYPVSATWTLGGAQLPHYDGWVKLKTWPNAYYGGVWRGFVSSPEAHFTVDCVR